MILARLPKGLDGMRCSMPILKRPPFSGRRQVASIRHVHGHAPVSVVHIIDLDLSDIVVLLRLSTGRERVRRPDLDSLAPGSLRPASFAALRSWALLPRIIRKDK